MKLLTIFDNCVFAKEIKMGNIKKNKKKANTSLWVSNRKIKDILHSISLGLFRKKYCYSGADHHS